MKLIDLYNKIANEEEVPYKIKYNERIYEYAEEIKWYLREDLKNELTDSKKCLNDEVEIIEDTPKEDKKIEKLELLQFSDLIDMSKEEIIQVIKEQRFKINEIIDKINGE